MYIIPVVCPAEAVYQDASRSRQAPTDAALAVAEQVNVRIIIIKIESKNWGKNLWRGK